MKYDTRSVKVPAGSDKTQLKLDAFKGRNVKRIYTRLSAVTVRGEAMPEQETFDAAYLKLLKGSTEVARVPFPFIQQQTEQGHGLQIDESQIDWNDSEIVINRDRADIDECAFELTIEYV